MKILLIGDEEKAPYHPLSGVVQGIYLALQDVCELTVTTAYKSFLPEELRLYDAVLSYIDTYQQQNGFDTVLADYVREGGKLLALHNGIISLPGTSLEQVLGGSFTGHPPYTTIVYEWQGKELGRMGEEPYMVQQLDDKNEIFLQFVYEGVRYPAGWLRSSGIGRAAYLAPGHDARTSENKLFGELLRRTLHKLLQD